MITFENEQERLDWIGFVLAILGGPRKMDYNQSVSSIADELIELLRERAKPVESSRILRNPDKKAISKAVKQLRHELQLTQIGLAYRLDVPIQTVHRWEAGAFVPSIEQLTKLHALAISSNLPVIAEAF